MNLKSIKLKKEILKVCSEILCVNPNFDVQFDWGKLSFRKDDYRSYGQLLFDIFEFIQLDMNKIQNINKPQFRCDAFLPDKYNCILELDDWYDFNTKRHKILKYCTQVDNYNVNYDINKWIYYCEKYSEIGDGYQYKQKVNGFGFSQGKASKRALIDCLKDCRSSNKMIGEMNPIIRISYYDLKELNFNFKEILDKRNYRILEKVLSKLIY